MPKFLVGSSQADTSTFSTHSIYFWILCLECSHLATLCRPSFLPIETANVLSWRKMKAICTIKTKYKW